MSGYAQEKSFAVVAEARRRWSVAEKQAVVAETEAASVSAVARRHGVSAKAKGLRIAKLEAQIARLKRMSFGRSSEKLDREIAQLELELDELGWQKDGNETVTKIPQRAGAQHTIFRAHDHHALARITSVRLFSRES